MEGSANKIPQISVGHMTSEKLTRARTKLLMQQPFLGYLVANLEDRIEENLPTAATDGHVVYWGKEFLNNLSDADTMFIMAHEAMHCVLQHLWRRNGKNPIRWNIACDAVINDMLEASGLRCSIELITGAQGRSAEELYENIKEEKNGKNTLDDHSKWGEESAKDRVTADKWAAAASQAKQFGKIPGGLELQIDNLLYPKRDWRDLLLDGLRFPEDYQWTPCDRRFPHVMLPTLTGEKHRVVIAIDTSGSTTGPKLSEFWAEVLAILHNNKCEARVITCDTVIQNEFSEHEFDPSCVKRIKGGGGTDFRPVFEKVNDYVVEGWSPEAVVFFTDLDGCFPRDGGDYRTIWVVGKADGQKRVPFGEVIEYD